MGVDFSQYGFLGQKEAHNGLKIQIVILCNFWTVWPTDLHLIFLEMAAY